MTDPRWSVRLALEEAHAGPVSGVAMAAMGAGVHNISIGRPFIHEEDEPVTFTIELEALSAKDARLIGQHKLGELHKLAGLPVRESPVVWVARLSEEHASSLPYLDQARDFLEGELFEMAVLAAQVHLEVQVRLLVQMTAETLSSPVLDAVISRQNRWAPHERWLRPVLEALFEVKMSDYPRWADYEAHIQRRNAVVHGGQEIDADSARTSLDAVSDFWLWLNTAATSVTTSK
jgi:hypothetical protein